MSKVEEAINEWFGPRCEDFEPGCSACDAWAEYDAATSKWRNIETAPKDGTLIIAWCQHRNTPCTVEEQEAWGVYSAHFDAFYPSGHKGKNGITIARWGGEYLTDDWQIPNWWFEDDDFEQPVNPTHWMPLPAPPETD